MFRAKHAAFVRVIALALSLGVGPMRVAAQYLDYPDGYDNDSPYYEQYYSEYYGDYDYGDWENANKDVFEMMPSDCSKLPGGKVAMNGTQACDVRVSGLDTALDKLPGGLDGVYNLVDCHLGHPVFRRQGSQTGAGRMLYFNIYYQDWNFIHDYGVMPTGEEEELAFGSTGLARPQSANPSDWQMNCNYTSIEGEYPDSLYTDAPLVSIECINDVGINVDFSGTALPSSHAPDQHYQSYTAKSEDPQNKVDLIEHPGAEGKGHSGASWFAWLSGSAVVMAGIACGVAYMRHRHGSSGLASSMANGTLSTLHPMDLDSMGAARVEGYVPPTEGTALLADDPEEGHSDPADEAGSPVAP